MGENTIHVLGERKFGMPSCGNADYAAVVLWRRWLTLGNQLGTDQIYEEDLAARIRARYPDRAINVPSALPNSSGINGR